MRISDWSSDVCSSDLRPGDIWQLGPHRIGCGDSRDLAFLQAVIGDGALIDAAFLDPPYNVRINGHANAKGRHREFAMASGEMTDAALDRKSTRLNSSH